jgi:sugar O-acyltransferase (sialic acid O-acetyltransferase NeuD family)
VVHLIGAGGHASVVADVARRAGHAEITVWAEDEPRPERFPSGTGFRPLAALAASERCVLAFGDLAARRQARERFPHAPPPLVDPSAVVGAGVDIGAGVVIMPVCVINANARIGEDAIINTGCIVEHDCHVGRNSHLSPGVRLAGAARVGDDVHVGTGGIVLPGVHVGAGAVIGAGAVVTRDVAPGTTVVGVPAAPVRRE